MLLRCFREADPHERGKAYEFTEGDWNLTATPQHCPYFYSKMVGMTTGILQ